MKLIVENRDVHRIRFAYSPLGELASSLRVLAEPKRHGLILPWIKRTYDGLSGDLREEYDSFIHPIIHPYMPHFFAPTPEGRVETFELHLAQLIATPDNEVIREMTVRFAGESWYDLERLLTDSALQQILLKAAPDTFRPVLFLALNEPQQLLKRVAIFCQRYWDETFAPWWDRIEPILIADIVERSRTIRDQGLLAVIGQLGGGLELSGKNELQLTYPFGSDEAVILADLPVLVLCPSALTWPNIAVEFNVPYTPLIVYPSLGLASLLSETVASDVSSLSVLKALADDTRLAILQLLQTRPHHTQMLSRLLGLSEAGVSKHLKILYEAGLVIRQRRGYFVEYAYARTSVQRSLKQIEIQLLSPTSSSSELSKDSSSDRT